MRNSAFRTVTTNSRGVKSSLIRMTLCKRGRSILISSLVLGLVLVSVMAERFRLARSVSERLRLRRVNDGSGCGRAAWDRWPRPATAKFGNKQMDHHHTAVIGDGRSLP